MGLESDYRPNTNEARVDDYVIVKIPIGSAYDIGELMAVEVICGSRERLILELFLQFDTILPQELKDSEKVGYAYLDQLIEVGVKAAHVEAIAEKVLSITRGRDVNGNLMDQLIFEGYRNGILSSFLILLEGFAKAGGKVTSDIKDKAEQSLS